MGKPAFQSLRVCKLAEELADAIWESVFAWKPLSRDTVGKQIVRAADSIGANIAEGFGRNTVQDHRRFLRIARGSLNETIYWVRRAYKRQLLTPAQVRQLQPMVDNLGPQLNAYMKSLVRPRT